VRGIRCFDPDSFLKEKPRRSPGGVEVIHETEVSDYMPAAFSITAWVQAPSGVLVMTGSEPPDIKVAMVRS
jgi:hypothetical protein